MVRRHAALATLALGALAACSSDGITPVAPATSTPSLAKGGSASGKYIVQLAADAVPADFAARIAAVGGKVESQLDGAGIVIASSSRADFRAAAAGLAGVEAVTPDAVVQLIDPNEKVVELSHGGAVHPGNDPLYPAQWQLPAIDAPAAWDAGYAGEGARVAILDGAIYSAHPDLDGNLDVAASRSFVPGFAYNEDTGNFWHGTHVAGIVAAEDNTIGVLGVAPRATLIGVKVLHSGSGEFSWVLSGMYYASTPAAQGGAGADIINMSLGAIVPTKSSDKAERSELKDLIKSFDRAAAYANRNGTTVIASAGNSNINFDEEGKHTVTLPGGAKHVIAVSATAPIGWAATGATNFSERTSYTNTGKSLVDLSAPGGDSMYPGNEACTVGPIVNFPCWVFDLVLSTSRAGYSWAGGTSMAAPMVSGVAALIIGQNGGDMHPAQVEAALRQSAIDLGKPGKDEVYGHGWVNAARAVGATSTVAGN